MSTYEVTKRFILWNATDYSLWREELEFVLLSRNLWDVTFGDGGEAGHGALKDDALAEARLELKHKREQAASYINLCLDLQFRPICVNAEKNPRAMMRALDAQLKPQMLGYRVIYLHQFMRMRHEHGEALDSYFQRINKVIQDLGNQDFQVPDDLMMAVMLDGLPAEYKSAQTFIESTEDVTYMQVKRILIQWEVVLVAKESAVEAVNYANGKGGQWSDKWQAKDGKSDGKGDKHSNSKAKSKGKCYYCDQPGHLKCDCRKWKEDEAAGHKVNSTKDDGDNTKMVMSATKQALILHKEEEWWYLDSGATVHVTCKKKWLHDYVSLEDEAWHLILGDDHKCRIHGYGTVRTVIQVDGQPRRIVFTKVLYAPELAKNLISTARIAAKGNEVWIHGRGCNIIDCARRKVLQVTLWGNMLTLPIKPEQLEHCVSAVCEDLTLNQLHHRFGHVSKTRLKALIKSMGISVTGSTLTPCGVCTTAKATRKAISSGPAPRSNMPFNRIHSDVCGPLPVATPSGKRYYVSFIDDHSCYATIYLIHNKDKVLSSLCHFLDTAPPGRRCCVLRSDQGGEYKSMAMGKFYDDLGLSRRKRIQVYCDNQLTLIIANSKPGEHHQRSKHYGVKLALVRDYIARDIVSLHFLPTKVMPADFLTKALGKGRTIDLRESVNMCEPPIST